LIQQRDIVRRFRAEPASTAKAILTEPKPTIIDEIT
jgi:hypothetical protein